MKEIYLTNNKGIVFVDNEDYEWLQQYKWNFNLSRNGNGYATTNLYLNKRNLIKHMHRLIMNEPIGLQIDHIDNNGLNNQKNNLRIVTNQQNQMNRKKGINCSSKYKGVTWKKQDKQWQAQIQANKKYIYLGLFRIEEDAAKAYNEAAIELFGEYAHLNEVKL